MCELALGLFTRRIEDESYLWLDVAVDKVVFVENKDGVKDLFGDIAGNRFFKGFRSDDLSSEITEGIVIHRNKRSA